MLAHPNAKPPRRQIIAGFHFVLGSASWTRRTEGWRRCSAIIRGRKAIPNPGGLREKVAETPDGKIEGQGCSGDWRFARYWRRYCETIGPTKVPLYPSPIRCPGKVLTPSQMPS